MFKISMFTKHNIKLLLYIIFTDQTCKTICRIRMSQIKNVVDVVQIQIYSIFDINQTEMNIKRASDAGELLIQ